MSQLSYKQKSRLPKSSFAVKTKKGYGGKGKYPIPDEAHARNALARVAQFGSQSEKAKVHAAVSRKFPHIGKNLHVGKHGGEKPNMRA